MILAGTGHRPNKLGGYGKLTMLRLCQVADEALKKYKPSVVVSGMALGWDQALALSAIENRISLVCAIPFKGQEDRWPIEAQKSYRDIITLASDVQVVSNGGYALWKFQTRNEWMVDYSDAMLALWNGDEQGGTWNCIQYARLCERPIYNVWPEFAKLVGH